MKNILFCTAITATLCCSCKKDSASGSSTIDCTTVSSTYSSDVAAIVSSSCATNSSCHASGSNEGPGALTTYQQVYNNRSAIRSSVATGSMPRGSSLSTTARNKLICWIDNGSQNN